MALSLRQKQLDAVVRMLNLNHPVVVGGTADEEVYKVLILDRYCRDILSPLIRVNDLRKHGITLYLMIDSERQNIPDVPAIYFVQPNSGNIRRITVDAARGIYESFHLNFASSLPRALLEELAAGTLKADCLHRIAKVYDQYLDFVTLEKGLFSLSQPEAFLELNDPSAQENDVMAVVEGVVNGLFSVLATLGVVPVIRCATGGPAEMVATLLDTRLRDHLVSRNNLFAEAGHTGSSFQRPVLCLFDRNFELSVAVQHVWSYRPLVHDVLGLKLNRVSVQAEAGAPAGKKVGGKFYELDDSDSFWVANAGAPFPKVAEEVQIQLDKYKQDVEEVNRRTGGGREGDFDDEQEELLGNTKHLMSAVNSLPQLTERKRTIDKHTNIATALLGEIKARGLDIYYSTEEEMLTSARIDKNALNSLLTALKGRGSEMDKMRLAIVFLLATETSVPAEVEAVEAALRDQEIDLAPFLYVKRHKSLTISAPAAQPALRSQFAGWTDGIYDRAISAVTAGVKNLLSGSRQLALTRAVESLMDAKLASDTESYLLFDPRGPKSMAAGGQSKGPFKEAIVFMIGGGNYQEYSALQELAQRQQPAKNIIYGTTEILSGQEFVDQLAHLGRKMSGGASTVGLA